MTAFDALKKYLIDSVKTIGTAVIDRQDMLSTVKAWCEASGVSVSDGTIDNYRNQFVKAGLMYVTNKTGKYVFTRSANKNNQLKVMTTSELRKAVNAHEVAIGYEQASVHTESLPGRVLAEPIFVLDNDNKLTCLHNVGHVLTDADVQELVEVCNFKYQPIFIRL